MRGSPDQAVASPVVRDFDSFYRSEYRKVVALAAVLSGSRWAAEDLAQEAFWAAQRRWAEVGTYEYPNLWVRQVVANKAVSLIRRNIAEVRARTHLINSRPPLQAMPDESEAVWDAVRRLPARQAQAFALTTLEGLSADEAGLVLGCSGSAVRTHVMRARQTLSRRLGLEEGGGA
ncbi:MAG TPA: sigma-70 family RNA polymerase sigma factor [Acidimicrobiia bacterium]|jgi:RNA polymerase sigma-70 factor (ECF subfamily)